MKKLTQSLMLLGLMLLFAAPHRAAAEDAMPKKQFLVLLEGTRADWPNNMTPDEEAVLEKHFVYLRNLMYDGTMLLAGPAFGLGGVVVLQVADEAGARDIMDKEPSVVAGVHTYKLYPFVASLMHGRDKLPEQISNQRIDKTVAVNAPLGDVWRSFTTSDGLKQFLGINSAIELKPGGRYEWYFNEEAASGDRGGEGCRVLAYLPQTILAFTWNAPPKFEAERGYRTEVVMTFKENDDGTVTVNLSQIGWGVGGQWNEVYDYFDQAWGSVLDALKKHFD